jgi:hypothetical protein
MNEVLEGVLGCARCGCIDEKGGLNAENRMKRSWRLRRDNEE